MKKVSFLFIFILLFATDLVLAQTDVRVLTYNVLNFPDATNADIIGNDASRSGYFRQVVEDAGADIIIIQELTSDAGADMLVTELNNNGTLGKTYNRAAVYTSYNTFSPLGNMLIYNDDIFDFVSQTEIPRNNSITIGSKTTISPRANSHYQLSMRNPEAECPDETVFLDIVSMHLKAGDDEIDLVGEDPADRDRRALGVQDLMDYLITLPANSNVIVGGDFNFQTSDFLGPVVPYEPAYGTLTTTGSFPLNDPLGTWIRNTASEINKYTQSPRTAGNPYGNGGSGGGIDDRFDFWMFSGSIQSNSNFVSYIANSYDAYGNDGSDFNGDINAGTNSEVSQAIADAMHYMSDHIPVIMDLRFTFPSSNCTVPVVCAPSSGTWAN